jgi:4-amino-4-deoxy-L-arabinose transferase-like glycosyltransferase
MSIRPAALNALRLSPLLVVYLAFTLVFKSVSGGLGDEPSYLDYANNLWHGFYAEQDSLDPTHWLWHGPGLPALLAPAVGIGLPIEAIRVLSGPIPLFLAVLVFHRTALMYVSAPMALVAAYALGLYPPVLLLGNVSVEPLTALFAAIGIYQSIHWLREGERRRLALGGLAFAGMALCRVEYGWVLTAALLLALALLLSPRARPLARRSAAVAGLALLACVPWLVYTATLTDRPFVWGNSGGLSIYWMSSPPEAARGDWHNVPDVYEDDRLASHRPYFDELAKTDPIDRDAELQSDSLDRIRDNPGRYLKNVGYNVSRMVLGSPYSFESVRPAPQYALPNLVALAFVAWGLLLLLRRRVPRPPELWPLCALILLGVAIHVPVSAYPRFLHPLMPGIVLFVVMTVGRVLDERAPWDAWARRLPRRAAARPV